MSSETHTNGNDPHADTSDDDRNLPVLNDSPRLLEQVSESFIPAPAVAATGGFLAGIATLVLVRILRRSVARSPRRGVALRRSKRGDRSLEIAGSRSFLVDVHMLKR
jgi:hypothetical protein